MFIYIFDHTNSGVKDSYERIPSTLFQRLFNYPQCLLAELPGQFTHTAPISSCKRERLHAMSRNILKMITFPFLRSARDIYSSDRVYCIYCFYSFYCMFVRNKLSRFNEIHLKHISLLYCIIC